MPALDTKIHYLTIRQAAELLRNQELSPVE